jgi:hypothetical protein
MTTTTCKIQWIDDKGTPTPDENPAIGEVRVEAYREPYPTAVNGYIDHPTSEWFPICADHARRLSDRGMGHWTFKPISD